MFTRGANGFGVEQIPWDCEARYRIPVTVWRDMIEHYFPNSGWLRLTRDTIESLAHYKAVRGLTTWDEAVDSLLARTKAHP